jgi:hypothetical protein
MLPAAAVQHLSPDNAECFPALCLMEGLLFVRLHSPLPLLYIYFWCLTDPGPRKLYATRRYREPSYSFILPDTVLQTTYPPSKAHQPPLELRVSSDIS